MVLGMEPRPSAWKDAQQTKPLPRFIHLLIYCVVAVIVIIYYYISFEYIRDIELVMRGKADYPIEKSASRQYTVIRVWLLVVLGTVIFFLITSELG